MTQFTTELLNFLAQKQDIDEFFRTSLETAMNDLLQAELSAFLGYEPYEKVGYNSGIDAHHPCRMPWFENFSRGLVCTE